MVFFKKKGKKKRKRADFQKLNQTRGKRTNERTNERNEVIERTAHAYRYAADEMCTLTSVLFHNTGDGN